MTRVNFEAEALAPFLAVVQRFGLVCSSGQGRFNQLALPVAGYFQFGDLRVDLPSCHAVVEVESAGGVTNLVKYWYCLERGLLRLPVVLFHVFRQVSANDYASHLALWGFLAKLMHSQFGPRFQARVFTYRPATHTTDLANAVAAFESLLAGAIGREPTSA